MYVIEQIREELTVLHGDGLTEPTCFRVACQPRAPKVQG